MPATDRKKMIRGISKMSPNPRSIRVTKLMYSPSITVGASSTFTISRVPDKLSRYLKASGKTMRQPK